MSTAKGVPARTRACTWASRAWGKRTVYRGLGGMVRPPPQWLRVGAVRRRAGALAVRRPRGADEVAVAASGSAVVGAVVSVTVSVSVSEPEDARGSWGSALPAVSVSVSVAVAISETK